MNKSTIPSTWLQSISPIWIVPFAAIIIAAWLAIHAWQKQGAEFEIEFDSASGIQVGQTQIRLKDVSVGKVTKLKLSQDLSKVRVTVTMDRQISQHLSEDTRFWLASPRVSTSGISNLGTLISGVYIVMDPGKQGSAKAVYQGLAEPPTIQSDDKGTQLMLSADTLGTLDIGSPVYYRQLKVGEVTGYKLRDASNSLEIRIFIKAPHDKLVMQSSRFWNVSGINVTVDGDGVRTQIGSLASIINGGVAFENTAALATPQRAKANQEFYLYPDRNSLMDEQFSLKHYYLLKFNHTVRGLKTGAAVEFRGIKIGNVVDVKLHNVDNKNEGLYVYVAIEPQRLHSDLQPDRVEFDKQLDVLVRDGLKAKLKTSSLITGAKIVDLIFPVPALPGQLVREDKYSVLPTLDDGSDDVEQQLSKIAANIQKIPLEKIGQDLSSSLNSISKMLAVFEQQQTAVKLDKTLGHISQASSQLDDTLKEARQTLSQLSNTLGSLDGVLNPDSETQYDLRSLLESTDAAAQNLQRLVDKLNDKPNALIFGDSP